MTTLPSPSNQASPKLAAVPRYLSAVLSQGLVSGFHFALNLVLVRLLLVADFGIFALTFVLAIMASSVGNALVSTPLCVYAPAAKTMAERLQIESMLTTLMTWLLFSAFVLGIVLCTGMARAGVDMQVVLAALAFILAYLARQYSRSFGYARFDVIAVLIGDIVYVATAGTVLCALYFSGRAITSIEVFAALSLGNILAVTVEFTRLEQKLDMQSLRNAMANYRDIWLQARWALIGAVTTVVVSQAHSVIVSTLKSPAAYAPLAAGFVLFGPVRVIFTTIQNVLKPEMSLAIAQSRPAAAKRQMVLASLLSVLAVSGLILLLLLAWPILNEWLYSEKYADAPMKQIVLMWAAITLISAVQNGPFAALQSLRAFRDLAMTTVYGSILSLSLVAYLMHTAPIQWSIGGIFMAESFVATWVVILALQMFRSEQLPGKTVHT